jgi:hypothetical protein
MLALVGAMLVFMRELMLALRGFRAKGRMPAVQPET